MSLVTGRTTALRAPAVSGRPSQTKGFNGNNRFVCEAAIVLCQAPARSGYSPGGPLAVGDRLEGKREAAPVLGKIAQPVILPPRPAAAGQRSLATQRPPKPYFVLSLASMALTSAVLISPVVVTLPSMIFHSRNGPVMSPDWSKATGPITPS